MKSRMKLGFMLIVVLVIGWTCASYAQEKYPHKPIQLIVGYGPGGAQDLFWRSIQEDLEKNLKVPISVVNKPGAVGLVAADYVSNTKNDGYTVLGVATVIKTVIPAIDPKAVRDVDILALCFHTPIAMVNRSESDLKSLKDVVEYAKKNPGKLTCANQGVQSEAYFDLYTICSTAGIKITHVPNPKPTEALADVLGGHIDFYIGSLPGVLPLYQGGRLRVLGFTGNRRLPDHPELPTFTEQGFPKANLDFTAALMGPKNLPKEVISAWQGALKAVLENPDVQASLRKRSMYVDLEFDRDKINAIVKEQHERVKEIAAKEGIKVK